MISTLTVCTSMMILLANPTAAPKKLANVELLPIELHVVSYTNAEREKYKLPPLEVDMELMQSARDHCSWMTRNQSFQHNRRSISENIAMGQTTSSEVVRDWMNSSGHRANILDPTSHRIGVGVYRTDNGTIYWCQQFRR